MVLSNVQAISALAAVQYKFVCDVDGCCGRGVVQCACEHSPAMPVMQQHYFAERNMETKTNVEIDAMPKRKSELVS